MDALPGSCFWRCKSVSREWTCQNCQAMRTTDDPGHLDSQADDQKYLSIGDKKSEPPAKP